MIVAAIAVVVVVFVVVVLVSSVRVGWSFTIVGLLAVPVVVGGAMPHTWRWKMSATS
jgi:hypothetical protein